jgi:hypothetical protein
VKRIAFVVALLASGAAIAADQYAHVYDANKAELKAVTDNLGGKLKDPSSIQLRNVRVRVDPDRQLARVCGEFNAKNAMGGYVGFQKFYGDMMEMDGNNRKGKDFVAVAILSAIGDDSDAYAQCKELGM